MPHLQLRSLEEKVLPAVTTSFDVVAGRLVARSDAADVIVISVTGPVGSKSATVNGHIVAAATDVKAIVVNGGPGANRINLFAVTATRFPALTSITVDAGAGKDTVYGSMLADDIAGGADNDNLFGYDGNDTLRGGGGRDFMNGGLGDDLLKSSDPITTAFNDTSGLNANPTGNSPFQIGANLLGGGASESGWNGGWQQPVGSPSLVKVQNDVVYEGD